MRNRDHLLDTFYLGRARNDWRHRGSRLKAAIVRWVVMWWDLALGVAGILALFVAAGRYLDTHGTQATELAQLRSQVAACSEIQDVARAIDNTPSGSRTDAGRTLAQR